MHWSLQRMVGCFTSFPHLFSLSSTTLPTAFPPLSNKNTHPPLHSHSTLIRKSFQEWAPPFYSLSTFHISTPPHSLLPSPIIKSLQWLVPPQQCPSLSLTKSPQRWSHPSPLSLLHPNPLPSPTQPHSLLLTKSLQGWVPPRLPP